MTNSEAVLPEGETTAFDWADFIPKADKIDYIVAVCCGAFSGLIDVLFVGEFSIERANEWGDDKVNKFVLSIANREREREGKSKFSTLEVAINHPPFTMMAQRLFLNGKAERLLNHR